jgi:SM-20-related protein
VHCIRYFVWDDFITKDEAKATLAEIHLLNHAGQFKNAQIGKISSEQNQVRTDQTYWFELNQLSPHQAMLFAKFQLLKNDLNANLYLGLWDFEGHYSWYFEGGYYHQHLDSFQLDDKRILYMVLYINPDWHDSDGGELRITHDQGIYADIAPISGRLVCFLSSEVSHEVRITTKDRFSFAGWWKKNEFKN